MSGWLDALFGRVFNANVEVPLSGGLNFTGALEAALNPSSGVTDVGVGDNTLDPGHAAAAVAGLGAAFAISVLLTAGTPGTADDVTVFAASAPFAFQILDCWGKVGTGISTKTATLRSAAAGGGSALSSALDFGTSSVTSRDNSGAAPSVSKGGSLYVRRSDRGVAGTVVILIQKTGAS